MSEFEASGASGAMDAEDQKLVTLAKSARARNRSAAGAAVRDTDGRTYVATTVELKSLQLSALQLAIAMAVSSGARGLEAAVVFGDDPDTEGARVFAELAPELSVQQISTSAT